jgi:hypothetical protein
MFEEDRDVDAEIENDSLYGNDGYDDDSDYDDACEVCGSTEHNEERHVPA